MSHSAGRISLKWGEVTAEFEPWNGWLRNVTLGERLLVRSIYCAVRGADWSTKKFEVEITHHKQEGGGCELDWVLHYRELGFTWHGSLRGCLDGSFFLEGKGTATEAFETRRAGLCLLHPCEQKGLGATAFHPDGSSTRSHLPEFISPDSPFFDISGLTIDDVGSFSFAGEIFEMEDQRNWGDASYKTYCRPQSWPQPYSVDPGADIWHQISFVPSGSSEKLPLPTQSGVFPNLGVWARPGDALPDWAKFVFADSLLDDWTPSDIAGLEGREVALAWQPGKPVLPCSMVFTAPAYEAEARSAFPEGTKVFAWFPWNFTEINRSQPLSDSLDGIAFGIHGEIHADDEASIMENTFALTDVIESAHRLAKGRPIVVAPLQLGAVRHGDDARFKEGCFGNNWVRMALKHIALGGPCTVVPFDSKDLLQSDMGLSHADYHAEFMGKPISLQPETVPGKEIVFSMGDNSYEIYEI
jgi:hypothetical protein